MILFHFHIWIVIFLAFRKELDLFFQAKKKSHLQIKQGKKICLKKANKIYESSPWFAGETIWKLSD